jgi:hypothetical protein
MMFLPDGRLVPATSATVDMFRGASGEVVTVRPLQAVGGTASALRALIPAISMFAGAAIGYKSADKHQALGAIGGAAVGGILGLIFR